jgi:hypothetical protein
MEMREFQAFCSLSLGEAQVLAGRLEEAYALAERTLALTREHQERGHQAMPCTSSATSQRGACLQQSRRPQGTTNRPLP